ncbi:beta-xylosidase [Actinoplanes lobatus]|uniref:Beta-xylosidase n=1 Tax=Actinoplanes lobatus TaxID=113568 RepID=A0A7W7HMM8_9ACTN|nr:glycoside hydrolase 43 family protein [Actinoplanes lobatus]MBB4753280.1 beta-xylosidase [Actinoplanes lobatus]GGN59462.1 beta-xylosidase [Actinoplanes lobatus]GIE37813.1 beta-xylosidase [Actinoplanes lobatus]
MTDRFHNPILYADWPDPDVVRRGDDFYLVASSFNRVPGLPLLHSTNLVDWRIIGHALTRLVPDEHYRVPRPGCGVWAPSLRLHDGRFWICYPDPDFGIYVTTAEDPAGEWSPPRLVLTGQGLIDPCPLWDDDGSAYLVHGWAKSRCGFNNRLTAYRMAPDLSRPLGGGALIVDGDAISGCRTLEGPKWYRRDGWYWIFAPGGGVTNGWQYVMRSRHVFGPYESRIALSQGGSDVNGPHQGAWVSTPGGEDWFVHFQDREAYGRITHLQPMTWVDGWPVIGDHGTPVRAHRTPDGLPRVPVAPATSDTFPRGRPGPQWSWSANPSPGWIVDHPGDGLRLACVPGGDDLRTAPNLLGQPLTGPHLRAETMLRLSGADSARGGITVLGRTYAWIGLERTPGGTRLTCRIADAEGEAEKDAAAPVAVPDEAGVRLAVTVTDGVVTGFAAEYGGERWECGLPFTATPGGWIGATVALFATGPDGHADFAHFHATTSEQK